MRFFTLQKNCLETLTNDISKVHKPTEVYYGDNISYHTQGKKNIVQGPSHFVERIISTNDSASFMFLQTL